MISKKKFVNRMKYLRSLRRRALDFRHVVGEHVENLIADCVVVAVEELGRHLGDAGIEAMLSWAAEYDMKGTHVHGVWLTDPGKIYDALDACACGR